MNAAKTMDPDTSSSKSQAEFLETEKSLMLDRLRAKENQVREQLGPDYLDQHPVITKDVADAVAKIDRNIAKLRGEPSAPGPGFDKSAIEAERRRRGLLK